MRITVIYRPVSEHGRITENYIRDFSQRFSSMTVETLDIDSREGGSLASLYDIMQYPAIMVTRVDGSLSKLWQGEPLPLMDEVAAYART